VLTYFEAPPERIGDLERDVQLSELVLRALVLRAEKLTEERLAELRAHPPETPLAPPAGDGRRHADDRRGHDRRPPRGHDRPRERPGREHEAAPPGAAARPVEPVEASGPTAISDLDPTTGSDRGDQET
jgi:hypothetical protein